MFFWIRRPLKRVGHFLHKKYVFSLMPSGRGKTLLFTVSLFQVTLGVLALGILTYLFTVSFLKREALIKEVDLLKAIEGSDYRQLNATAKAVLQQQSQVQTQQEDIQDLLSLFQEVDKASKELPRDTQAVDMSIYGEYELLKPLDIPNPIQTLSDLHVKTLKQVQQLKNIENFVKLQSVFSVKMPVKWPIHNNKGTKTSAFGIRLSPFVEGEETFHTGVDIAAVPNTPIVAAADGIAIFVGTKKGYGNTIILMHAFGYKTLYGHNAKNLIKLHQKVQQGDRIALLGNTGRTTGYHLHFEIRLDGIPIDPWSYLTTKR